jgi:hypothetical protein
MVMVVLCTGRQWFAEYGNEYLSVIGIIQHVHDTQGLLYIHYEQTLT